MSAMVSAISKPWRVIFPGKLLLLPEHRSPILVTLARQATPVIMVRATKKITVIISEGKELEIREIEEDSL